jgi:hypothetical protein
LGLGLLRSLPSLYARSPDGDCPADHSLGLGRVERHAAALRALHPLRTQGRLSAAPELGRHGCRLAIVPRRTARPLPTVNCCGHWSRRQRSGFPAQLRSKRRAHQQICPQSVLIGAAKFDSDRSVTIVLPSRSPRASPETSQSRSGMRRPAGVARNHGSREAPGETRPSATTSGTRECARVKRRGFKWTRLEAELFRLRRARGQ